MTDDATSPHGVAPDSDSLAADVIIGSTAMRDLRRLVDKIATTNMSVCLWGERGTGKRHVGRAIHNHSSRRAGPFVVVDCAEVRDEVVDEHLLDMSGSAANGACKQHHAMLARAHSGTLVLNDPSALGLPLQARLLETLRTRLIPESGGGRRINIRILATMSTDPVRAVEDGRLLEDLYYRVAMVMIRMPALRERPEDIPLLAEHFLRRLSTVLRRRMIPLAPGIVERMVGLPWPGNVRQLEDLLRHAFLLSQGDVITDQDLTRGAMALEREGGVSPLRKVS